MVSVHARCRGLGQRCCAYLLEPLQQRVVVLVLQFAAERVTCIIAIVDNTEAEGRRGGCVCQQSVRV